MLRQERRMQRDKAKALEVQWGRWKKKGEGKQLNKSHINSSNVSGFLWMFAIF